MRPVCAVAAAALWAGTVWASDQASGGPILDESLQAPSDAVVEEYGGEAGWVLLRWSSVPDAVSYRVWREVRVVGAPDPSGSVVQLDQPKDAFVPWAKVDQVLNTAEIRAKVSTMDNIVTRWAVSTTVQRDGIEYKSVMQTAEYVGTLVGEVTWGGLKSTQSE